MLSWAASAMAFVGGVLFLAGGVGALQGRGTGDGMIAGAVFLAGGLVSEILVSIRDGMAQR